MAKEPVERDDRRSSGLSALDSSHQELLDLHSRIVWATANGLSIGAMRERIRTFLLYARWHFNEEEVHMQALRYPGYVDHRADHRRLLQDAEDFMGSLGQALKVEESPAIATYFKHWLCRHMANQDVQLRAFLSADNRQTASADRVG